LEDKYNQKRKGVLEFLTERINLITELKKNNNEKREDKKFKNQILKSQNKVFNQKILYGLKVDLLRVLIYIFLSLGGL
jgi:hypothetical protein